MKCPLCDSAVESTSFRSVDGRTIEGKRCTQCNGIWFPRSLRERIDESSLEEQDAPLPNYSAKSFDLICPIDHTLLRPSDHELSNEAGRFMTCPDCDGCFFPRGQLSLYSKWLKNQERSMVSVGGFGHTQAALSVMSIFALAALLLASINKTALSLDAAQAQTLPTSGPNVITLSLLAVTYLAGTILAVLGRKLPVIVMGWGVIVICLFGFSLIIFGP